MGYFEPPATTTYIWYVEHHGGIWVPTWTAYTPLIGCHTFFEDKEPCKRECKRRNRDTWQTWKAEQLEREHPYWNYSRKDWEALEERTEHV